MFSYIDLLGKPFSFGGKGPEQYDCAGLMWELSKRLGHTPIDFQHIQEYRARNAAMLEYFTNYERIQKPEIYAIILFNHQQHDFVTHVGMMVDRHQFIHTSVKTNVVVEKLKEWSCRINSIYRLK